MRFDSNRRVTRLNTEVVEVRIDTSTLGSLAHQRFDGSAREPAAQLLLRHHQADEAPNPELEQRVDPSGRLRFVAVTGVRPRHEATGVHPIGAGYRQLRLSRSGSRHGAAG